MSLTLSFSTIAGAPWTCVPSNESIDVGLCDMYYELNTQMKHAAFLSHSHIVPASCLCLHRRFGSRSCKTEGGIV